MRERNKNDLIVFLRRKVGRWDSVWWNGELLSIGEALGRASDLQDADTALCSHDEVLIPAQLRRYTSAVGLDSKSV